MPGEDSSVLPVIDIRLADDPKTRPALAKKLFDTLKSEGFMYVEGIEGYDSAETLKWTHWFFALPKEVKDTIARQNYVPENMNVYRGYFPVLPGNISHKEGFELGQCVKDEDLKSGNFFLEDTPFPESTNPDCIQFKKVMEHYWNMLQSVSVLLLGLVAEAAGVDTHYFDHVVTRNPLSTLRLMHYPTRSPEEIPDKARLPDGRILTTGEHADSPILTLLDTFHYTGLQYRRSDGIWVDIPKREGALVGNIGEMLSRWSGGVLKATIHRVLDMGENRFSMPFFMEPSCDGDISIQLPTTKVPAFPAKLTYGTYLMTKLKVYAEYEHMFQNLSPKMQEMAKDIEVQIMHPGLITK